MQSGTVFVHAVSGEVSVQHVGSAAQPLHPLSQLECGTIIKTGPNATADLILGYNRTVLRLTPNSALRIVQLDQTLAGETPITETKLELVYGAVAGSQRKLALPSFLEITTPKTTARIKGTEYYVSSSGAVSVVSGAVSINYNLPGNGGSVKVTIPAGYSFDPASQTVVPTTPALLQNIIDHIITTKKNAETFKAGGATIVVKPEDSSMSPSQGNNNGNNGVGNGVDPQPPGNPPVNDGPGTSPGNPGNSNGNGNGNGNGKNK